MRKCLNQGRGLVSHYAIAAAAFGFTVAAMPALAQDAAQTSGAQVLGPVRVGGEAEATQNTNRATTGISRIPEEVQDIPQGVKVIPQELIRQQAATTLEEVLRNAPGITMMIGENGQVSGDNLRIRGFDARSDVFTDGLRDFGNYTRDAFNYEQVSVLQGPSSSAYGRGTVGGAIEATTKVPNLIESYGATVAGGTGPHWRGTADVNMPIGETVGVRLNGMYTNSEVAGRDLVESERWAIAPSVGVGLGTDTTFTVSYIHQEDDRVPDYGVPIVNGTPVTDQGVNRRNFYGTTLDRDDTVIDVVTARFKHQVGDWLTLTNDTRYGRYTRDFAATAANCPAATCVPAFLDNDPLTVPLSGRGGPAFELTTKGFQNLSTAVADFETGALKHRLLGGIDYQHETTERLNKVYTPARPATSLLDPDHTPTYSIAYPTLANATATTNALRDTTAETVGFFLNERMWFTPQFSIQAGMRWENYKIRSTSVDVSGTAVTVNRSDNLFSPTASAIWEPSEDITVYFTWAQSERPISTVVASAPTPISVTNSIFPPEKSESFEVGAKFSFLQDALGVGISAFSIKKDNALTTDSTGTEVISGDAQKVQGFELSLSGQVTQDWSVYGGYTYLDAKTTDSTTPAAIGSRLQNTPKHAASLWTTYKPLPELTLGGGLTYRSRVFANTTETASARPFVSVDALVSYDFGKFTVSLNANNLFNRVNYSAIWGSRVMPAPKRTFLVTAAVNF